jgi:hypothetical protein
LISLKLCCFRLPAYFKATEKVFGLNKKLPLAIILEAGAVSCVVAPLCDGKSFPQSHEYIRKIAHVHDFYSASWPKNRS